MGDTERHWTEQRQKKYRELYKGNYSGTGMFVMRKRKQLLGIEPKTGKAQTEATKKLAIANFNYDVRENVKLGLVDLQLFIETAEAKEADAVVTRQTLENILTKLLSRSQSSGEKAKIAQCLAEQGLEYLRRESKYVTKSQNTIFDEAIDASKQLTLLLLNEKEKEDFFWTGESRM